MEDLERVNAALSSGGPIAFETTAHPDSNGQTTKTPDVPRVQYKVITSAELDSGDYTIEYLIDRTLVAGQPCIVAGPKKAMKTSIMIDMGVTLAVGGHFLGKLPATRQCRVMVMTGESGLGTIQETARRIAAAAGHDLADLEHLLWSVDLPKFGHLDHMDALGDMLVEHAVEVLIIDPAYLCMPSADAGNLMAQGELLRSMNDVCSNHGAMMTLAHHTTQSSLRTRQTKEGYDPVELEDIAWAGFQEWARQWLLVGRRQKYEPGTGEHPMWLNVGGSAGHSALWAVDISEGVYDPDIPRTWDVSMRSGWDERQLKCQVAERAKNEEIRTRENEWKLKLWDVMKRHPDGQTGKGYREIAGLSGTQMARALDLLEREGRVEPCRIQKGNGQSYGGIRPVDTSHRETGNASGTHRESTQGEKPL